VREVLRQPRFPDPGLAAQRDEPALRHGPTKETELMKATNKRGVLV
jgi:hypothetical protein